MIRGVGTGAAFAKITADLYTNKDQKAYGYFSGIATDIHLDFHDAVFKTSVSDTFDKYKVPSTIYLTTNATAESFVITLADSFPVGQVVRVINDGSPREIIVSYNSYEEAVNGHYLAFNFVITPAGKLAVYGGG